MHPNHKHIDQLVQDKANSFKADNSFMMQDFAAIQNALPKSPLPIANPTQPSNGWFSLNNVLFTSLAIGLITTVIYFSTNSKKDTTAKIATNTQLHNDSIPAQLVTNADTPVVLTEMPKDPSKAPKKWVYRMQINFDKKNNTSLPKKQFINLKDITAANNDLNQKETIEANKIVLQNFLSQLASPTQVFTINNQQAHTLTCKDGTRLVISPNTFTSIDKKTVQGNVAVEIKEAYTYTDMIANNLHTVSNGNLLQSGGMVYINATQNKQPLEIDINNPIQLIMPTTNKKDSMQLFNLSNNNWVANGQWQSTFSEKFVRKNITVFNLSDSPKWRVNAKDKIIAKFEIPRNCPKSNSEMLKLLQLRYGNYYDVIKVRRLFYNYKTYKNTDDGFRWYNKTEMVGDSLTLPFRIANNWKLVTIEDSLKYEKEVYFDSITFINNAMSKNQLLIEDEKKYGSYNFSLRNFGWINCDRFYKEKNLLETYTITDIKFSLKENKKSLLLFPSINSLLLGINYLEKIHYSNIPKNKNVVFISFKTIEANKVLTCIQQLTTNKDGAKAEDFIELTPAQVKAKLDALGSVH